MTILAVWLVVFLVMLAVVLAMASGVLAGRKPIAGSCGGIANLGIEKECSICGNDFSKCENQQANTANAANILALPVREDADAQD